MRYKTAVVIAVWTETALWVIFFLLYVICVRVLTRKRTRATIQWIPLLSASLLFLLATTHIGFQLRKLYEGLVLCSKEKGGSDAYFMNIGRWLNVVADGIYITMILVGDSVVIHRCYLIWGRRVRVIIMPTLLLLGTGASGYFAVWLFTQLPPTGTALEGRLAQCTKATFLLSLATNLSTTVLIAYRIISTARKVSGTIDVRPYMAGLTIIIESAAMYTTALVIYLIIYVLRTNAQYIMFCALCPIIGIVPTLIIVRVGLGLTNTTQIEVSPPTPTSPTFDIYPPTNTDTPHHITPVMPSYSPWPRSPHTRDVSGSEAAWGDTIHLELRYSQGSVGRYITSDDISRNSTASFGLGLVMTKTNDSKV